jgi:hypothetical protein
VGFLDLDERSASRSCRFAPDIFLDRILGGSQSQFKRRKILTPHGLELRTLPYFVPLLVAISMPLSHLINCMGSKIVIKNIALFHFFVVALISPIRRHTFSVESHVCIPRF